MGLTRAEKVINSTKPKSFKFKSVQDTAPGQLGYDNVRDDIEKVKKISKTTAYQIGVALAEILKNIKIKEVKNG